MPETNDVKAEVEKILEPFSENDQENSRPFWDWYQIGGRWSGEKIKTRYPKEAMDEFFKELSDKKVTVSGFTFGKQTLQPSEQIPMVDQIWKKHFPDGGEVCPVFDHYKAEDVDICLVKDIPKGLSASRVIVAFEGEAVFMIEDSYWNGVDWSNTNWDKNVLSALEMFRKKTDRYKEDYKQKVLPKDNWVCVTVDYHN